MSKLVMHWQVRREGDEGAEFFLFRQGDAMHCDHRRYSREELERRAGAMAASIGDVPVYYQLAIEALEDPTASPTGEVEIGTD